MSMRNILIGLGAGLAAALLFAGLVSGTALAFPLFILSPLPIAIAGLGFGTYSAAAAAALASAMIGLAIGHLAGGLYFILFAAPVAWAAHLVGLSRPVEAAPDGRQWFPLDGVLVRATLVTGAAVVVTGFLLGYDPEALIGQTVTVLKSWLAQSATDGMVPTEAEIEPLVRFNIALMPFTSASLTLGILVLATWLGARIARMSGLLTRTWTPLWTVVLPQSAALIFGIAFVVSLTPGVPGQIAGAFAGAMGFAFALTGFGLLHAMLIGKAARPLLLFLVYAVSFVFLLPLGIMAVVGLADTALQFRARRFTAGRGIS
ncbi:MAG: hypothetical protein P0Y66_12135 [Candidatus Kaistia colombiensis]|nr:MAG: hypothetical protein P0Y66_12135 [Kaistia sp.]